MNFYDKEIIEVLQLEYSELFLKKQVSLYNAALSKSNQIEFQCGLIKDVLDATDYIENNSGNKFTEFEFTEEAMDMENFKSRVSFYYQLVKEEKSLRKLQVLIEQIYRLKIQHYDRQTLSSCITIFNKCLSIQLSKLKYSNVLLFYFDDKYLSIMFKYSNGETRWLLFLNLILGYNEDNKDRIEKITKKMLIKYPDLISNNIDEYIVNELLKIIDLDYLKLLCDYKIIDLKKLDFLEMFETIIVNNNYDLGLYIYENSNHDDIDQEILLELLLNQNDTDDKEKLNNLCLKIIQSPKFPMINEQLLNQIKSYIVNPNFGKNNLNYIFEGNEDLISVLNDAYYFIDSIDEDYCYEYNLEDFKEMLLEDIENEIQLEKEKYKIQENLFKKNMIEQNKISKKDVIDKQKFIEDLMSALINKTSKHLENKLLETYDAIKGDNKVYQKKLIKTLYNILNDKNKRIDEY